MAWYGDEDEPTESVEVDKCGLCGGDEFKKDNFKDTSIELMAHVTARNVRQD